MVRAINSERDGLQRVSVELANGDVDNAYVLTHVIGPVAIGDEVVVNTTAVDLGLGTGGSHVVHWNLSRSEWSEGGAGHIMKARYTSVQIDAGAHEETTDYKEPQSLDGMPVVVCLLHSQLAAVAVAIKHVKPEAKIAFVMSDEASLPYAISDLANELRSKVVIDISISAGQAFGGDHEAVNVASGIGIAKSLGADVVIVAPGPGVVGTGTKLGFGGLTAAGHIDAIAALGGTPIFALRYSEADARERHQGVSHQAMTVLERCFSRPLAAAPRGASDIYEEVDVPDMHALFTDTGLEVKTMGRSVSEDTSFFDWAAAAGILAAQSI